MKMYEDLDNLLSEDCSDDSWYDDGFIYAQELLNSFSVDDWEKILQSVNEKSDKWKIKLAYCIDGDLGISGLQLLMNMLNENDEVVEAVLDSLRSFQSDEYKNIILSDNQIISKTQSLIAKASFPVKKVLETFLKGINLLL